VWSEFVLDALAHLSPLNLGLMSVNLLLLLFSRIIVQRLSSEESSSGSVRLHLFRAVNLVVLLFVLFHSIFLPFADRSWITRLLALLVLGYLAYLCFHLLSFWIKKRFGREREVEGGRVQTVTYHARLLSLLSGIFILILVLVAAIRILGFESLLEAGGVIGLIGVFLALTQGSWAPDIISGLVILNSRMLEEGDVVQMTEGGETLVGVVYKTKVFHTEMLNLVNNHRIMFKNSRLRDLTIHNLSKFASARGLRERLLFKIAYQVPADRVRAMFQEAFERALTQERLAIEEQSPLEIRVNQVGDFAVEWSIFYYTKTVRDLLKTRQLFLEVILKTAIERDISLATPMLHEVDQG
jgi:small-conductance mechanosensitive channel